MDRRAAKELAHIQGWLNRVEQIAERGEDVYLADALLQEAGDSLMMKVRQPAVDLVVLVDEEVAVRDRQGPNGVDWGVVAETKRSQVPILPSRSRSLLRRTCR